jgi:hypothetical protein
MKLTMRNTSTLFELAGIGSSVDLVPAHHVPSVVSDKLRQNGPFHPITSICGSCDQGLEHLWRSNESQPLLSCTDLEKRPILFK